MRNEHVKCMCNFGSGSPLLVFTLAVNGIPRVVPDGLKTDATICKNILTFLSQNQVGIVRSMLNAKPKCNSLPEFYIISLLHVYQSHSWLTLAAKQKRM